MYLSKYHIIHQYPDGSRVLLNTLGGGMTRLDDGDWPASGQLFPAGADPTGNLTADGLTEEERKTLLRAGLLFGDKEEEDRLVQYWMERRRKELESEPVAHVIYLSYHCNLKCTYCCYAGLRDRKKVMERADIDRVMRMVEKTQRESGRNSRICLFGGEPLQRSSYGLVEYALESIKKLADREREFGRRCRAMIFTNGMELPFYRELLGKYREYIEHILVTLIGTKSIHDRLRISGDGKGSFDRVARGVGELLETGIRTWLVTNIDRTNLDELTENVRLVKERGWDKYGNFEGYYFGRIKYYDQNHENAVTESELLEEAVKRLVGKEEAQNMYNFGDMRLLKAVKNFYLFSTGKSSKAFHTPYGCSSGSLSQFSYDADGTLYTCSGAMGIRGYEIGAYSPEGAVDDKKAQWWKRREVRAIGKCRDCPVAFLCGGGCAYAAKEINGSEYLPCCTDSEKLLHTYLDAVYHGIRIRYRDLLRE